ncbi:protein kinase, partial [Trypanosoma cruzi]
PKSHTPQQRRIMVISNTTERSAITCFMKIPAIRAAKKSHDTPFLTPLAVHIPNAQPCRCCPAMVKTTASLWCHRAAIRLSKNKRKLRRPSTCREEGLHRSVLHDANTPHPVPGVVCRLREEVLGTPLCHTVRPLETQQQTCPLPVALVSMAASAASLRAGGVDYDAAESERERGRPLNAMERKTVTVLRPCSQAGRQRCVSCKREHQRACMGVHAYIQWAHYCVCFVG